MKIFTEGCRQVYCQLPRIEQGFRELGHDITPHIGEADLIYFNNPPFSQVVEDKRNGSLRGKIVLNVLDIPIRHIPDYDYGKLSHDLSHADAITSISKGTQADVLYYCGLHSKIIYQPINVINNTGTKKYPAFKMLFVGRVNDSQKRTKIGYHAAQIVGFSAEQFLTVGTEVPGYGSYCGVINGPDLDDIYNSVDFVWCGSLWEGLGLPIFECLAAGKIPIICKDFNLREEFFPAALFPEYLEVEPTPESVAKFIIGFMQDNDKYSLLANRLHEHYNNSLKDKFSYLGVAKAILEVYDGI